MMWQYPPPRPRTLSMAGAALPKSSITDEALLQLRAIEGTETLSTLYTYTLDCVTDPEVWIRDGVASLDLQSIIGKELTVTIQLDGMGTYVPGMPGVAGLANIGQGKREISGIVTEARFTGETHRQGHYRLLLQPWLFWATQHSTYRIFQHKTVVEIIDEVLHKYMYSWDKRLSATYEELAYQVQYGETDFAFLQRLMEEHGIYWFFEHSNTFHRMVLVDQLGAHKPVDSEAYHTLNYFPPDQKIDAEYIDTFDTCERVHTGIWSTGDFDFEHPKPTRLDVENALPRDTPFRDLKRYEWPGDYRDLAIGEAFARVRMQELYAQGSRAWGSGHLRLPVISGPQRQYQAAIFCCATQAA